MNKKYGVLDLADFVAKDGKVYYSTTFSNTLTGAYSEVIKSTSGNKKVISLSDMLDFSVVLRK